MEASARPRRLRGRRHARLPRPHARGPWRPAAPRRRLGGGAARRLLPGPPRHVRRGRHHPGALRARGRPLRGLGLRRLRGGHGQGLHEGRVRFRGPGPGAIPRDPPLPARAGAIDGGAAGAAPVREAGQPRLQRGRQQGQAVGRARRGPRPRLRIRSQDRGGRGARCARDRARDPRQRGAGGVGGGRDHSRPRVLRLRLEVLGREPHGAAHPRAPQRRGGARGPGARRARVPGRGRERLRAHRFPDGPQDGKDVRERDQHHPRLHVDQHVPQALGRRRPRLRRPALAPRRARSRAPSPAARAAHRLPLIAAAALLLAAGVVASPSDREYRAALDLLYDGRADAARVRLRELEGTHPGDPVPVYLQALVLAWIVEQQPETTARDRELEEASDRAFLVADARLRADPGDARALFARGAARGLRSRHHLFRAQRGDAARTAAQMREDLRAARDRDPEDADVLFGLGLYDYYVDVLPRFARLLRFLSRLPAGDRARGLAAIEEAARSSMLHGVEARVQLYEIHAFYEDDPEAAAADMEELARRYPGWPLWRLKLAEHLRDRLGAYAESGAVARRMLDASETVRAEAGPGALALARLSLGESLLLDLRPEEARQALLPLLDAGAGRPALAARARLLIGRSLELEGESDGAAAHYRAAAADRESRKRAQSALARPLSAAEVEGRQRL